MGLKTYAKYILKEGTSEEKRELIGCFKSKLKFTHGAVTMDLTLVLDFKNAFKIAEKYHAEALCAEATSFNFAECKTWR